MLLVIDVSNTNMVLGVFNGENLVAELAALYEKRTQLRMKQGF